MESAWVAARQFYNRGYYFNEAGRANAPDERDNAA